MGKRRTHLRHGNKAVKVRLTGDVSAELTVFISHADQDHTDTTNFDSLIDQRIYSDTVDSGGRRPAHHGSFTKDTTAYASRGRGIVRREHRLLKWIVPPDRLEAILGDLAERFRMRARPGKEQTALEWYSRQLRWTTWHESLRLLRRICGFAHLLQRLGLL